MAAGTPLRGARALHVKCNLNIGVNMIKKAFLFLVVILQTACATTDHLKENVRSFTSDNYVMFEEDVFYIQSRGVGYKWKEGLRKGIYKPELENEYGTFYRGPEGCVTQFMEEKSMGPFDGGIWIPKDRINYSPMIYYYFNYNKDDAHKVGGAVALIVEAYKNDITFMPPVDKGTFLWGRNL